MNSATIRRGQVYLADLNPPHAVHKNEPSKIRPVVIASIDDFNQSAATVIVFPISKSVYPDDSTIVYVRHSAQNGLDYDGGILPFLVRGISKGRLQKQLGWVTQSQIDEAVEKLNLAVAGSED